MSRPNTARLFFFASCLAMTFSSGFVARHYEMLPYRIVIAGVDSARHVLEEQETLTGERPVQLTRPARHDGSGVVRYDQEEAFPGITFMASFFDDGNESRFVRMDGSVLHRWPVRYFEAFPNPDHVDEDKLPQSEWNLITHGRLFLPDGSMVFNFENLGTAKIDRCGEVEWTVPRMTHHSLTHSRNGGYWVGSRARVLEDSPFPLLKPPYIHESILELSADGDIVREISLLDILFKNNLEALLFSNGIPGLELPFEDVTHLNDVEELSEETAPAFPQFEAGDLMLSMRSLNMIMVVDPDSLAVKWHQVGPWIRQHDPDFQPNGKITILSNNDDGTPTGSILGGSQIVEIDPVTRTVTPRYGGTDDQRWFTRFMGKHQILPNGNILITESESGRVFEVNSEGDVVWEFINRYDDEHVAMVTGAERYDEDYFEVAQWSCD